MNHKYKSLRVNHEAKNPLGVLVNVLQSQQIISTSTSPRMAGSNIFLQLQMNSSWDNMMESRRRRRRRNKKSSRAEWEFLFYVPTHPPI